MNLVQSQGQSLILTPQLQTSLAILKASAQDIEAVLAQIAEGNPCFEIDEEFGSELGDNMKDDGAEPPSDVMVSERFTEGELPQELRYKVFANMPSRAETLEDYLTRELTAAGFSLDILPFIDERGYFTSSLSDRLDLTDALVFIRNLEPKGLGAYDSKDCLLMQLGDNKLARVILTQYEELFIKRRIPIIASLLNTSCREIEEVYTQLAKLNPIPASEFAQPEPYAKLPEVFLDKEGNITGDFKRTPKYKVSQHWLEKLASSDEEAKAYLRDKIKDAKYYLKAIALRNTTVVEVFRCIYKVQHRFFTHGEPLLPLSMHQIAEELSLHETTISRAVSGKYVSTPKGVFELKRFFSLALIDSQGKLISNNVVKQAVLDCISSEDKQRPFSDEEIMHRLKLKDIDIARRTIAKYRNLAGIPNSNLRVLHAKPI